MSATRRPSSTILCTVLAAGTLLVSGARSVRADDLLEQQRRINAALVNELKVAQREALIDARSLARKDPAKAAELLKQFRVRIEDNKVLTVQDQQRMLRQLDDTIRLYDRSSIRANQREADRQQAEAVRREQARAWARQSARQVEMQQAAARRAQLYRDGKFEEAYQASRDFTKRFGGSPSSIGFERSSRLNDALQTVRSIRDERDQRYVRAMRDIVVSSMPIQGDVEFPPPEKWKALTKRRSKQRLTEEERKLIKALSTPITTTIKDKPIEGVIKYLETSMADKGLPIHIEVEKAALDQLMLNYESPISGTANGISLRAFLKQLFGSANLTYVIRNGKILVTTPDRAAQMLVVKTYYVGDLLSLPNFTLGPLNNQLQMVQNIAALVAFIQSIEPTSWQPTGPGTIFFNPVTMSISVKQTAEMQLMLSGGLGR